MVAYDLLLRDLMYTTRPMRRHAPMRPPMMPPTMAPSLLFFLCSGTGYCEASRGAQGTVARNICESRKSLGSTWHDARSPSKVCDGAPVQLGLGKPVYETLVSATLRMCYAKRRNGEKGMNQRHAD